MKEFDFDELDRAVNSLMEKSGQQKTQTDDNRQSVAIPRQDVAVRSSHPQTQTVTEPESVKIFKPAVAAPKPKNSYEPQVNTEASPTEAVTQTRPIDRVAVGASNIHQRMQFSSVSRREKATETHELSTPEKSQTKTISSTEDTSVAQVAADHSSEQDQPVNQQISRNPVIPHRTGRFMDMKPPGHQTKTQLAPSKKPSRQGITLQPTVGTPVADVVKQDAHHNNVEPTVFDTVEPKSLDNITLDAPSVPHEDTYQDAPSNTEPAPTTLGVSDFSAFLTDVKPEKRPLNTATTAMSDEADQTHDDVGEIPESDNHAVSEQLQVKPADAGLSEEFNSRLLEIESGEGEKLLESGTEQASETIQPRAVETTPIRPTGPTSIPRQYDELPSSGPHNNGAIFDTATYHKPLEHPAKKSHGFLWVFLILIVIFAGAALGAAVYMGYL